MRGGELVLYFLLLLQQVVGISFLDDASAGVTVGDVQRFSRHLVDEARLQFSKTFSEELSVFRQGLDVKSVGLRRPDAPTEVVLEGELRGQETFRGLELVTNTDRPLALLASDKSGLLLVRLSVRASSNTLVVTPIITLRQPDFHSFSAGFVSQGLLFYSVTLKGVGERSLMVDAIIVDTLTPMDLKYRVDVRFDDNLLHFFEHDDILYFVVNSLLYVYKRKAMYFDRLDHEMLDTKLATSITGFSDTAGYYIVVGMRDNVESPVYVFDPKTSTLHLTQRLVTQNVTDVQHFHDFYTDKHYILLLQDRHPAKIYWFGNEQLLEWQDLSPFHGPASASFATLGNENIIAIANQSEILLLVDNLSGHYKVNHTIEANCAVTPLSNLFNNLRPNAQRLNSQIFQNRRSKSTRIEDVFFMNDPSHPDEKYILAYKCITDQGTTLKFDILEAKEVFLAESITATHDLLHNINELEQILDSDQHTIDELEKILAKDSIMLTDSDQTWSCSVSIEESLVVEGALSVDYLKLTTPEEQNDRTMESLVGHIETLQSNLDALEKSTKGLLYGSQNQLVTAPVSLNSLDTSIIDFSDEPVLTKLNGLSIQDLETSYLRKSKNQTISTHIEIDQLVVDRLRLISDEGRVPVKQSLINGIQTKDMLRKSIDNQVISGHHTFSNLITLGNITNLASSYSPIFINDISTADIITDGTRDVKFTGSKTFSSNFRVDSLKVVELEGQNFDNWVNSLVRTNLKVTQTLTGNITIGGDLYVDGNVDVASVNNVNLREFEKNILRTTGPAQIVEGPVIFSENVTILGNLNVSSINNIRWNDIIDSSSDQKIVSKFIIEEANVAGDLHTDDVNGRDLSTDAVLQGVNQIIEGRTNFTKDVIVRGSEGVTMDRLTRVNGVDPSELRALLGSVGQVIIREEFHHEEHLSFNCNINIDTLNGILVDNLPTNYWRKNLSQTIPVDVTIPEAIFNAPLKAESLNGVKVDQYLLSNRDQTITGYYNFNGGLTINEDLTMSPSTTVDGVDLRTLRDNVITLDTEQIITGEDEFLGGLSIDKLFLQNGGLINSVSLDSVALLNKTNFFLGNVNFLGPVHSHIFLPTGDISTGTLNNLVIEDEALDIVKVDEAATIKGDMIFNAPVEVSNFTARRNVDGINVVDLERNALKRVSPVSQIMTGDLAIHGNAFLNGTLNVEKINGEEFYDLVQSTVTNEFDGIIKGKKKFLNDVHIITDANVGLYNGNDVNLTLSSILTRSSDQNITADYTFGNVHVNELVAPVINGLSLDDVLLTHEPVNNSMTITFSGSAFFLELNSPSDIINGCDIKQLENHMNWRDFKSQNIKEPLSIEHLRVTNDVVSLSGSIILNSVQGDESRDFQDYMDSFVTKSSEQIITGGVQFVNNVSIASFNTPFINLVDADDVVYNSMRRSDQTINCSVNFRNTTLALNLVVQGDLGHADGVLIDGVNFRDLSRYSVRKSQLNEQEILGKKTFTIGLVVVDNFTVNSINGSPIDDFVTIGPDEIVEAEIIFERGIDIKGNLTVGGLLDGVYLNDVLGKRIPLVNPLLNDTNITFKHLDIAGDLLTSTINDVLLSDLVLTGSNATQLLTGDVVFAGGLIVDGDIEVLETLNGMDVADTSQKIAMMNRNELIQERVVFKGEVYAPNARVLGGRVSTLEFETMHSEMVALNKTVHDDLTALKLLQDTLMNTNEENLARVKALRSRFDYLIESAVFEQPEIDASKRHYRSLSLSSNLGLNSSLNLGLLIEPCDGSRVTCYCQRATQNLLVNTSGQLSPSHPIPGVLELKKIPFNPNVLLEMNTTCLNDEPSTTFTIINVNTTLRSQPQIMPLDYVIKSEFLTPEGQLLLAVISEQAGSESLLSILKVNSTEHEEPVTFIDYVLVSQELSDLCVLEFNGVWSVVVTGKRRPNTDGQEAKTYRYEWEHKEHKLVLRDIYPGYGVSSCLMFSAPRTRTTFLILAQEDIGRTNRDHLNSSVLVFRQSPYSSGFERYQSLGLQGVVGLTNITIGDQLLVAMVTRTGLLYIYQLHYSEGFQAIERVRLPQANPNGIIWIGPSTVYSKANQTGFQDSNKLGKGLFTENDVSDSRARNHLLYNVNKAEYSRSDRTRRERLYRSGLNGGNSDEEDTSHFDSKLNDDKVDYERISNDDGGTNDAIFENAGRKVEFDGEGGLFQPRFIIGYDNHSITPSNVEGYTKSPKETDFSTTLLYSENPLDVNARNSSPSDQGGNFGITETEFPLKLTEADASNIESLEIEENGTEKETSTNKQFEYVEKFESRVTDKYDDIDPIYWRSAVKSQPDSLIGNINSRRLFPGPSVPEPDVIIQHPSYLAVGSATGLMLYEIRTSGIDGERLLSEVKVFEE